MRSPVGLVLPALFACALFVSPVLAADATAPAAATATPPAAAVTATPPAAAPAATTTTPPAAAATTTAAPAAPVMPAVITDSLKVPAGTYKTDPTHTSVTWKLGHMNLSFYTARFAKTDGTLTLDPANPANTKLSATVDPKSVKTDYPHPDKEDFDKKIGESPDFLNGLQFPSITFESKKLTVTGPKTATVEGELTLRGITKPQNFDITFNGAFEKHPMTQKAVVGFSAVGTVDRTAFGMQSNPFLGDIVQIIIETELMQQ